MEQIVKVLTHAMEGAPAAALAAAFAWGAASILLSPCHLSSIPLIVGFIDAQGRMSARRALLISVLFASGILLTIGVIGGVTAAAGRMLGDVGRLTSYGAAAALFAAGLILLEVIPVPWSGMGQSGFKRKGPLAAFALGVVFGIALGPCSFAYMAAVMGVAFKVASTDTFYAVALFLAYGLGYCTVIVLAGTFTEAVQRVLNWNEQSRGAVVLKKVCGALVLLGGLYVLYVS